VIVEQVSLLFLAVPYFKVGLLWLHSLEGAEEDHKNLFIIAFVEPQFETGTTGMEL
jgi:hypothetical protein